MSEPIKGRCLCGAVEFEVAEVREVDACHCSMCRHWTGGVFIGADVRGGVTLTKDESLAWYDSSDWAKRGFCKICGASLFYRLKPDPDVWAISAGALDLPAGLSIGKEIFVDEKPDYYDLAGDQPRLTAAEFMAQLQSDNGAT